MAKVLVLEDDRLSQKVVGRVLSNAGHESLNADSTQKAWDRLQEHVLVDMVVLDNQLDQEWGWQFLRMVRSSAAYRGLPVVVYSAHNERSSVIRYLELGVQSLQVKPYQSEVILRELDKAVATKWANQVMEPEEGLCSRLGITHEEYGGLLATATRTIEENVTVARKRIMSPRDTILSAALASIDQQCRTVGIKQIEGVIIAIKKAVEEQDVNEAFAGLRSIEAFLGMIRHRMYKVLNMEGSVAPTPLTVSHDVVEPEEPVVPSSFAHLLSRDIISKPLWHYGAAFKRAVRTQLVSSEDFQAMTKKAVDAPPFSAVKSSVRLLESIPTLSVEQAALLVRDTRNFTSIYKIILERITGSEVSLDSLPSINKVLDKQGITKVLTLVAVAKVANSLPRGGILNLRQLFAQTLSTSLIAFEIGKLFRLANDNILTAAGLVHDSGRWLFAVGDPGAYALTLALTEDASTSIEDAEKAVFGMNSAQAGQHIISAMGESELLQAAALYHEHPSKVTMEESLITVCIVHVAHLLALSAIASNAVDSKNILSTLRDPNYPVWALLTSKGVTLPFETPELVDTMATIANTSNWCTFQFIDKA